MSVVWPFRLSVRILFEIFSLLHDLLEYFFVPFRRIAVLVQKDGKFHVKLIFDVITGGPVRKLSLIVNEFFDFLCQNQTLFVSIRESVIITYFDQNIVEYHRVLEGHHRQPSVLACGRWRTALHKKRIP